MDSGMKIRLALSCRVLFLICPLHLTLCARNASSADVCYIDVCCNNSEYQLCIARCTLCLMNSDCPIIIGINVIVNVCISDYTMENLSTLFMENFEACSKRV